MSLIGATFGSLFAESDRVVTAQERYNLATFMVLFFLITIEVVLVKVASYEYERGEDEQSYGEQQRDPAGALLLEAGDDA